MLCHLYDRASFFFKMPPIADFKLKFVFDKVSLSFNCNENVAAKVKTIICDGNRIDQAVFEIIHFVPQKPWLTDRGIS